jgi:hypothetical protein
MEECWILYTLNGSVSCHILDSRVWLHLQSLYVYVVATISSRFPASRPKGTIRTYSCFIFSSRAVSWDMAVKNTLRLPPPPLSIEYPGVILWVIYRNFWIADGVMLHCSYFLFPPLVIMFSRHLIEKDTRQNQAHNLIVWSLLALNRSAGFCTTFKSRIESICRLSHFETPCLLYIGSLLLSTM